jgi:hypothetical protein
MEIAATKNYNYTSKVENMQAISGVPRNFFSGGGSTNSVDRGRENRDLGAVAP